MTTKDSSKHHLRHAQIKSFYDHFRFLLHIKTELKTIKYHYYIPRTITFQHFTMVGKVAISSSQAKCKKGCGNCTLQPVWTFCLTPSRFYQQLIFSKRNQCLDVAQ